MKAKAKACGGGTGLSYELKYCECCGGLWLRPAGGEQIYCAKCGRAMADLPPASHERETAMLPIGPRWEAEKNFDLNDGDDGADLQGAGGVA